MTIEVVGPDDEQYEVLEEFMGEAGSRFDYKEFYEIYNESPVNFIFAFEYHGATMSNFVSTLKSRGLEREEDYMLSTTQSGVKRRGLYKVILKKLTESPATIK